MAKMIPPRPYPKAKRGEKRIYNTLKYAKNPRNEVMEREADFVILMPSLCTVVCLEVKDALYSKIEDGQWYRANSSKAERLSPPEQAEDAMWAMKGEFGDKYFRDDSLIAIGATSGTS